MVITSTAVDDADPLAAVNGARSANNLDPAAALSLFDVVHGTTATADVGAGTTPWWSSPPPYYAGSGVYASSSFPPPPPPPLQSQGNGLACYAAGSIMDTSFPQLPAYIMPPEQSYFYYPQQLGFPSPFALEPNTIQPQLQVPTTSQPAAPASMPPSLQYSPQTRATATGSASVEEASPALADRQQAQQDDTRPAPRRRGRPSKRALAVSEPPPVSKPTKRVAVARNRAASSSETEKTSSAATGSATMASAAGHVVVPDQAGASSSSTGSTSGQQTAACTSANHTMAPLLCEERCQLQRPAFSNGAGAPAAAGVVVEGHHQQAAIAPPPELTGLPRYADTSAVGVRFHPTDQELIGYLRMKYGRQQMPVKFFKEFDVYQAHPMAIKGACGESQNGCWYAFSRRDRKYRNGQRPARSVFSEGGGGGQQQMGFWKSNSRLGNVRAGGRKGGAVIGRMTALTFQLGRQPRGTQTGWKMKEYTIPENQHQPDGSAMLLNDWVVCKLFYKEKRPRRTNAKRKTDENAVSVVVGQEGNSEKDDKSGTSVGQKRPRRSRKSKKDKNAIPVAVGEAGGESVQLQGEEDMQNVPAAHQLASDYSEQADLCVEDYLVCDVAFAQQNDAANCTI